MKKTTFQLQLMFLSAAIATLSACGSAPEDKKKDQSAQARMAAKCQDGKLAVDGTSNVVGGQIVGSGSWLAKSAVMLVMMDRNEPDKAQLCTGALVDRDIVLTAAHCVSGFEAAETYVFFESKPECTPTGTVDLSKATQATRLTIHPDYRDEEFFLSQSYEMRNSPGDVALVKLSAAAPAAWRTSMISGTYIDPQTNLILAAGYGKTISSSRNVDEAPITLRGTYLRGLMPRTEKQASEQLRNVLTREMSSFDLSVQQRENIARLLNLSSYFVSGADQPLLFVDQSMNSGICQGDSGGAAFAQKNSKYYIVGVASFVSNPQKSEQLCSLVGAYTNTLKYKSWIDGQFRLMRSIQSSKSTLFE